MVAHMTALSAVDGARLSKMAGLLGSAHPGERDAAALAVTRFLKDRDLTWQQVLAPPAIEKKLPEIGTWRQTVARCLAHQGSLRSWERQFLADLPGFRRLSTKQRYCLAEIAARVLGEGRS